MIADVGNGGGTVRYCFFSAQYLPTAGGVERFTYNLARRLTASGDSVCVVTSALPGLPGRETDDSGIEILRLPSLLLMNGRFPVIKPGKELARLTRELRARAFDFCVINTYFYPMSLYASWWTRREGIPAVVINHGSAWLMGGASPVEAAGRAYERFSARLAHRWCGRFYGVSSACCQWMQTFGIQAEGILTNAIDPDEVRNLAQSGCRDWRGKLGIPKKAPIIAFVGRMVPEKGVEVLAAAMPEIRRVVPGAVLIMAGAGPLLEAVRARKIEGLYAVGELPYADSLSLLEQAQVFCLPTRSEGFACTVLEAAALECPIITTATGGSPQLLPDQSYGILLPDMSPEQTARACIQALENPKWRRRASRNARVRLEENYTWDRAVETLKSIEKRVPKQ